MKFLYTFLLIIISYSSISPSEPTETLYVNKEYTLKALPFEENTDLITVVYPRDQVEVIQLEENLAATNPNHAYLAKVRFNQKIGYIPYHFLQAKLPKNIPKIRKRAYVEPKKYYVTASSLYVREEPYRYSGILTSIYRDDEVTVSQFSDTDDYIDGKSAKWAYVEKDSIGGWVFSGYLTDIRESTEVYTPETPDSLTVGKSKFTIASNLHVRDEPSKFGTVVSIMPHGNPVKIIDTTNTIESMNGFQSKWVKIDDGDSKGWVFGAFLYDTKISKKLNDSLDKPFLYPLSPDPGDSRITSPFGPRVDPVTKKKGTVHTGIDLYPYARFGSPIYAAGDGVVIHQSSNTSFGNLTVVQHDNGLVTYYAHQQKFLVKQNEAIRAGDKIGEVGSTGKSTGPHLHFEVRTGMWKQYLDPGHYIPLPGVDE